MLFRSDDIEDEWLPAPLYQQAFRWFREKHKLDYWVRSWWEYDRTMFIGYEALVGKGEHCGTYEFYEKAELACLKKLIEIVNKISSGYSEYSYDIKGATLNNVIYPSLDIMIFEVKYPNTDIQGRVVPL